MTGIFKPPVGAQLNLDHPLAQGLVGCWLLNENSGKTVHDYSGQWNEGTLSGFNDPPIATSGWNAGPHGGALAFDGTNDYVNCGNGPALRFGLNDISVIIWVKQNPSSIVEKIAGKGGGAGRFIIRMDSGRVLVNTYFGGALDYWCYSSAYIDDGLSHQLIVVFDRDANESVYLDGKFKSAVNISGGSAVNWNSTNDLIFGGEAGQWFANFMSSASIYNRALSADEIAYLYAFPYCMFDEPAYPAWMDQRLSTGLLSASFASKGPSAAFTSKSPGATFTGKSPSAVWSN